MPGASKFGTLPRAVISERDRHWNQHGHAKQGNEQRNSGVPGLPLLQKPETARVRRRLEAEHIY